MAIKSYLLLRIIKVLAWIGFIGLLVKAGIFLFTGFVSMFISQLWAKNIMSGLDLSQLFNHDKVAYGILVSSLIAITVLEALLFYTVIRIFQKIDMVSPFNETVGKLIRTMSGYALVIGLLSNVCESFVAKYIAVGMSFPHLTEHICLGDSFIFFAGVLYFISILFARGIEMQQENELTV